VRGSALWLLGLYQKLFTLLGYGSCRYYPTCSEYARWRFEADSVLAAPFYTALRILRCNPLFAGGIDYPVVRRRIKPVFKKIHVRYWLVPKGKNSYYLIKNLD
jgi:putative membrane protein insertion efficiency factor